jgi:ATP:ADP antiporter, AAA family
MASEALRHNRQGVRAEPGLDADDFQQALHSPLDRLLTIFSDVRPGEGPVGFAMLCSVFLLLTAVYFLKPARDGLLAASGLAGLSDMELKAYSSLAQSLALFAVVPLYARMTLGLERAAVASRVTVFFIANLLVFWVLRPGFLFERVPYLGVVFYVWFGVFNLLCVVQFWSFAADLYSEEGGRRLFPAIGVGATAGAAVGSWLTKTLIRTHVCGTYSLLLAASVALAGSLALLVYAESRHPSAPSPVPSRCREPPKSSAFRMVLGNRFLLAVAIVTLLANWLKTNSDNLLFAIIQEVVATEAAPHGFADAVSLDRFTADQTTAFYGDFFFWVNLGAFVLQALVASRVLKYGGFGMLFLVLPLLSLGCYPLLAIAPTLALFRLVKIGEEGLSYSFQNTAFQVLWLPTTREMKYQGKAAIDTLFVRFGDGLAALTTFLAVQVFALPVREFFALNAVLAIAWTAAAIVAAHGHSALTTPARST